MTPSSNSRPIVSVVIPAFNEEENLGPMFDRFKEVLENLKDTWEMFLVDDGSTDKTWARIASLHMQDDRVKGIRLSRNFGHQYALMAGIIASRGQAVITADADLQHPPELIPELMRLWKDGAKIVQTVRKDDEEVGLFKRVTSRQYYKLFRFLSGVDLQSGMADYRLLDRLVVKDIVAFEEQGLFLRGIVHWVGYHSVTVPYVSEQRFSGTTKYSIKKMLMLAWQGVTSFSNVPLRLGVITGLIASLVSLCGVGYAIYSKLIAGETVAGWASSVAIISFLFAVLFIYLGILGEYVGRIITEVRRRPRYLISERIGIQENDPAEDKSGTQNT